MATHMLVAIMMVNESSEVGIMKIEISSFCCRSRRGSDNKVAHERSSFTLSGIHLKSPVDVKANTSRAALDPNVKTSCESKRADRRVVFFLFLASAPLSPAFGRRVGMDSTT